MADKWLRWKLYPAANDNEPTRRRRGLMVCEGLRRLGWRVDHHENSDAPLVVLQRIANPVEVRSLQANGRLVIFEQNDNLMARGSQFFVPTERETVAAADFVVVTCRYMHAYYARVNPKCFLMPEILENEFWTTPRPKLPNKPLVFSWHGMSDNLALYVEPLLRSVAPLKDVRLRVIMPEFDSKRRSNRERVAALPIPADFVEWKLDTFVHEMAQAHAGLVILPATFFASMKAHHKVAGYQALGMPVLASNVPGYREVIRHGETGLLAETPDEFRGGIEQLRNARFRDRLGKAGVAFSRNFTQDNIAKLWDRLLTECRDAERLETTSGGKEGIWTSSRL